MTDEVVRSMMQASRIGAVVGNPGPMLDASILQSLRVMDEQDHLQRYEWFNLPEGVDANLLERILYYRGRGALFYLEGTDKFYFLPFALDGSIDPYGRYERITPLAFNGSMDSKKDKFFIPGKSFEVLYDILPPNELTYEKFVGTAVILNDYSQQISQTVLPRARLQEPILQTMAELIPFCRTSLLNSTGISGVYVSSKDEAQSVLEASRAINTAALMGDKWIPITSGLDPKPLTSQGTAGADEFLKTLQSLDNYRLSCHGLNSGGLFQKGSHMLQAEQDMNSGRSNAILLDGLQQRQQWANIINSQFRTGTWCRIKEGVLGVDRNMDGEMTNEQQPIVQEEVVNNVV